MKKFRIVEKDGRFYPQGRWMGLWLSLFEQDPIYGGAGYFNSLNEAKAAMQGLREPRKPTVIHPVP